MKQSTARKWFGIVNCFYVVFVVGGAALFSCTLFSTYNWLEFAFRTRLLSSDYFLNGNLVTPIRVGEYALDHSTFFGWLRISEILGMAATLVLVPVGIGLIMQKPWAVKLSRAYAMYAIAMGIVAIVFNIVFVIAPMRDPVALLNEVKNVTPSAALSWSGGWYLWLLGTLVGSLLKMIYPVSLLYFMSRKQEAKEPETK